MRTVPLSLVGPSPNPVRKTWDEDKMQELAASIKERGVIVPIKVRPAGDGYEIVYGHRRTEAARRAGLDEIPAIVDAPDDTDTLIEALVENILREDMAPLDVARGLQAVKDLTGKTNQQIAEMFGWTTGEAVRGYLVLLRPGIVDVVESRSSLITPGHVKVAISSGSDEAAIKVLRMAANQDLSMPETRAVADAYKAAESRELKDEVIRTSGKLGDADRILQVARMNLGINGLHTRDEDRKRAAFEEYDQAVKEFLDFVKLSERVVKTARDAAKYGKFSPEGARFAVTRIDRLIGELETLKEALRND